MDQYGAGQNGVQPDGLQSDGLQPNGLQQETMPPKKILSRAFLALFLMAVVVIGMQNVIDLLVNNYKPELRVTDWYRWALTAVSLIVIGFPFYFLLIRTVPNSPKREVIKLKPSAFLAMFLICAAAMYITNFFTVILTSMISILKGEPIANPAMEAIQNSNYIVSLIYAAVIAPVFEELIFRKLLLDKLRRFGDLPAILMTGLAFGLFHFNLTQFFYAAVLGFLFAYVVIRTNTVIYSIILHMMINLISTVFTPLVTNANIIGMMMISAWVFSAIIFGSILFILNIKKIRLDKSVSLIKKSDYLLNSGVILFLAFSLAMIVLATVAK